MGRTICRTFGRTSKGHPDDRTRTGREIGKSLKGIRSSALHEKGCRQGTFPDDEPRTARISLVWKDYGGGSLRRATTVCDRMAGRFVGSFGLW